MITNWLNELLLDILQVRQFCLPDICNSENIVTLSLDYVQLHSLSQQVKQENKENVANEESTESPSQEGVDFCPDRLATVVR